MNEILSKLLQANHIAPDTFAPSKGNDLLYYGEVRENVFECWSNIARAFPETGYWPIIRGGAGDMKDPNDCDPASILADVPTGNIRELLALRFDERIESLNEMFPELAIGSPDWVELATRVDADGINSFSASEGKESIIDQWPDAPIDPNPRNFHTLKKKGRPMFISLVAVKHPYEVPAYLPFGGWNDCPAPVLQVAALREWGATYHAQPVCITGDVLECAVLAPPQTEFDAMKLATEQWIFCDDIVSQGTQSVRNLAMSLWKSPRWFFWWD